MRLNYNSHNLLNREGAVLTRIERVVIVGAGWVGRQVAAKMASVGVQVGLVDRSREITEAALDWMTRCSQQDDPLNIGAVEQNNPTVHPSSAKMVTDRRTPTPAWLVNLEILPAIDDLDRSKLEQWKPDLILESVSEQLSLKKRILRKLSDVAPRETIIASNSSYFVPSVLSQFVSAPERFAHLHFHVPVMRETVADIVGCESTKPEVLERLSELSNRMGQEPLLLRHEHPGYVFNWLLQAVLKAALELVAADVVDPADVDRSWKSVTGMPLGPFGMMDQIGLDVIDQVLSNARWVEPSKITTEQLLQVIRPLIAEGRLGVKSAAGFSEYPNAK